MSIKKPLVFGILLIVGILLADDEPVFPDFTLAALDGQTITLSEVCSESPVILTFWATWCKPCIKELRKLDEMEELLENHGVTLLAICEDGPRTRAKVKPFAQKEGWDFVIIMDTGESVKKSAGVADIPELFILSGDREILYHHIGFKPGDEAEYQQKVEELFPVVKKAGGPGEDEVEE
ncbi:hypothetical protein DRQ36_06740 [bacterium]|nr:MAG: hypothetical protein DRQ36_06740 [bacterium]